MYCTEFTSLRIGTDRFPELCALQQPRAGDGYGDAWWQYPRQQTPYPSFRDLRETTATMTTTTVSKAATAATAKEAGGLWSCNLVPAVP